MKNLYLIPTDKPSRLFYNVGGALLFTNYENYNGVYIYITSDEEIKEGDWIFNEEREPSVIQCIGKGSLRGWNKITLTTDQDLIADGIQAINDEFLEWFVKNTSCEEVEVVDDLKYFNVDELRERHIKVLPHLYSEKIGYKIIIPKEEPKQETHICKWCKAETWQSDDECYAKQETIEEVAERILANNIDGLRDALKDDDLFFFYKGVIQCYGESMAKWQQERSYSEEDMVKFAEFVATYPDKNRNANGEMLHAKSKYDGAERTIDLLKQYKK